MELEFEYYGFHFRSLYLICLKSEFCLSRLFYVLIANDLFGWSNEILKTNETEVYLMDLQ